MINHIINHGYNITMHGCKQSVLKSTDSAARTTHLSCLHSLQSEAAMQLSLYPAIATVSGMIMVATVPTIKLVQIICKVAPPRILEKTFFNKNP